MSRVIAEASIVLEWDTGRREKVGTYRIWAEGKDKINVRPRMAYIQFGLAFIRTGLRVMVPALRRRKGEEE